MIRKYFPQGRLPEKQDRKIIKGSTRKLQGSILVQQFRQQETDLRMPIHKPNHFVDGPGQDRHIGIQEENVPSPGSANPLINRPRKTHVFPIFNEAQTRKSLRQQLSAVIRGSIIHDQDLVIQGWMGSEDRRQTGCYCHSAVMVYHYDR